MGKTLITLVFFLIVSFSIYSQTPSSSAGTASGLILRFGMSAKVTGISGAFTGLANDENALYYNIAGLSNLNSGIISLNHLEWFQDIRVDNITFGYKFGSNFGSAISISHMWMPSIQGFNEQGMETESFDVSSSIVNVGIGYRIVPGFSLGLGVKYFQDKLAEYNGAGVAFDLGLHMKTVIPGFTLGLTVQNMGGNIIYDKKAQRIPITYRAGLAYDIPNINLILSTDAVKSVDSDFVFNLGVDYNFVEYISARVGNRFSSNEAFTPSFGLGIQYNRQYFIDYAFYNLSDLGTTHRFGFSFQFGNKLSPIKKKYSSSILNKLELFPPNNLKVEMENDKLIISWDKVTGARYLVYAKYGELGEWKALVKTPLYSNSLKINKHPQKGIYYFKVTAVINEKESEFSKEEKIDVD